VKRPQAGFTLVELMIVVVVVGILAAIAVPVYQNYAIRAKVSEALALAGACTTAISDYAATNARMPADTAASGCEGIAPTQYVASLEVADGVITITMAVSASLGGASGGSITMSPTLNGSSAITAWTCAPDTMQSQYLPNVCRGG